MAFIHYITSLKRQKKGVFCNIIPRFRSVLCLSTAMLREKNTFWFTPLILWARSEITTIVQTKSGGTNPLVPHAPFYYTLEGKPYANHLYITKWIWKKTRRLMPKIWPVHICKTVAPSKFKSNSPICVSRIQNMVCI